MRHPLIIDCHGHYTTAPKALEDWRNRQIANLATPELGPNVSELRISDDELRESIETNQLRLMKERGSDLNIFSPRASFMAHHIGDFNTSATWATICNELCYRVSEMFPDHFIGAAMLPQSPDMDPLTCIPELEKCVKEYGFVGIDPETGNYHDDTRRYIEASTQLDPEARHKIYEGNARRVFPRLDAALKTKGL